MRYVCLSAGSELTDAPQRRLGVADADFYTPCVMPLAGWSPSELAAAIDVLVAEPGVLINRREDFYTTGHPLLFELPDGSIVTERLFWTSLCEQLEDALDHIDRFVNALMAEVSGDLPTADQRARRCRLARGGTIGMG